MAHVRRREFIALVGAAAAWPLHARAQPPRRVPRIALLMVNRETDAEGAIRVAAFRRGLEQVGLGEGRDVQIDYHWAVGSAERAQGVASALAADAPDVVVANGTPAVAAMMRLAPALPVVFVVVTDPVGNGFVRSMAKPGGNVTGFSTFEPEIGGKWLELLREVAPGLARVAGILDPGFKSFAAVWDAIRRMGTDLGLEVSTIALRQDGDTIEPQVAALSGRTRAGLIVLPTAMNNLRRDRIIALAARYRLPAVYPFRHFAVDGGLMAYGFDAPDLFRRSGAYVRRILKGERPADLPVQAPVKYELVVNLKTAKALGLEAPAPLLARADEVIE
jgi:putative ABC transport system substrate-binding protein